MDGDPAETELGRPEGFLIVKVPAGEHLVDVQFKNTPARNTAVFITLGSLLVTIILAVVLRRRQGVLLPNEPLTRVEWRLLGVTVGVTAVAVLLLHPAGWLHMNSTGQVVEAADVSLVADFGEQIALLGYDTDKTTAGPNEFLAMTLYWKAQQELDINYQSFVHVLRPDGTLLMQSDHLNPGDFPTRRWPLNKYVRDEHLLRIPADAPPGSYTVAAGLWVQAEGWRLPHLDDTGAQIGDNVALFTLTIEP